MSTDSVTWRPLRLVNEGPSSSCVINGIALGWTNCTPAAIAIGVSKSIRHEHNPDDCTLRRMTGDTKGGTMTSQYDEIVLKHYGIKMEIREGSNVCTPVYAAGQLHNGRGFTLAGDAGQLVGTEFRSTAGRVNHRVWVNEGRGWHKDPNGHLIPTEVLVYDPAADGKMSTFGRRAQGPGWWSWGLLLQFASHLHPYGEGDNRTLGPGKFYAALFPDTEPHVHLRSGAMKTDPFPDVTKTYHPRGKTIPVRSGPGPQYPVVRRLAPGSVYTAFQKIEGSPGAEGERTWFGNHTGSHWIVASRLRGKGGTS